MSEPTRILLYQPGEKPLVRNTVTTSLPAPDAIKGGLAMLLIGLWGFVTRRDVTWEMGWMDRSVRRGGTDD